jgi:putative ATP-binding cassette transporter
MTDARTLTVDPSDYKITRKLFARIWRIAKPFWCDPKHWKIWILAIALLTMSPAFSYFNYRMAYIFADLTNAIVAKRQAEYVHLFWLTTAIGLVSFSTMSFAGYLTNRVNLYWTQWMIDWMVQRYLAHRTYYDIAVREDLDNPDQRIQADVSPVIGMLASIPDRLITQTLSMFTGGIIIAGIDPRMTVFVILYSILSAVVTLISYTPSIRFAYNVTVTGADLRYGILHVRDNAETVAFYKGEAAEHRQIFSRLIRSTHAQKVQLLYNLLIGQLMRLMQLVWDLAPFFLIAPLFFQGKIEYGAIAMATMAAGQMKSAMDALITFLPTIASSAPSAVRLAQILERFDAMDAQQTRHSRDQVNVIIGPAIAMEHVTLQTPGREQTLFRDMSFSLPANTNMVIVGQTGVGKSSLLRAVAGLWNQGNGDITMPPTDQCLFLPQRPYMILANLRDQLLYPRGHRQIDDRRLRQVLERVALPDLLEKHGGLDAVRDWGKVLSLGEQQRVAFARILISGAKVVFLDEATSAVDIATEARLYQLLKTEGITYISVGHRETILAFHDQALELFPGGKWTIVPIERLSRGDVTQFGMERA